MRLLTNRSVIAMLKREQKRRGLSARSFALDVLKISPSLLSEVYAGTRQPGDQILDFLNLEKHRTVVIHYTRKE